MPHDAALSAASGTWLSERETVRAALAAPVVADLAEFGVIAARGADVVAFLQGQLTNDVQHLAVGHLQLDGYCSPKGRLLAVFDCWRDAEGAYLQLPREILAPVLKRLSMFVLRAKVKLDDASSQWSCHAVFGPGASALLGHSGLAPPDVGRTHASGGVLVARLRDSPRVPERYLVLEPVGHEQALRPHLNDARHVAPAAWWWTQVDAAQPNVFAATQEKFVPQMINFEVLGGVNFKKGCFPGQEVVARSQYLGKLRRRMGVAHIDGETRAGADVFADGAEQPVGTVVMAASAPDGGMDLLFEAPIDQVAGATLRTMQNDGPTLDVRPLPYELFDPTA
jgi:folate-binding protein YgfZ